ncbi:MAG TPA: Type 1 glutamine amidotransferase-like domain-containing protein [Caulobacteraceae bacterium]|nr:Type 1 glutamine amidotransferase-like domain-containing protein [Caulobacteraceae bacterium]
MRFLLTSGGFHNATLREALVGLLGKPISEASALCVPTALHSMPGGSSAVYRAVSASYPSAMCGLGWKSLGVLELTALPSLEQDYWVPAVREADALLVEGGDSFYLGAWVRKSGLADLLPSLRPEVVWVGLSAGSMVAGPNIIAPEHSANRQRQGPGAGRFRHTSSHGPRAVSRELDDGTGETGRQDARPDLPARRPERREGDRRRRRGRDRGELEALHALIQRFARVSEGGG